ncbi:MAG: dienelactone hydrolase family protein [Rhodospirillales bacterium]|nr:dienelactone hydrolase family protein [Rhodospirillales bacterium]
MGENIRLTASDGRMLDAYRADPVHERKGSVVVVQEIFGVNGHIRNVCDRYARRGYAALAPALFDRVRSGVELDYDEPGIAQGRELAAAIGWDAPVRDIRAAAEALRPDGKVGVVGYCWGASWVWVAACRLEIACAACYYGRHIVELLNERPQCPVIMHFGADDASIPPETVNAIRSAVADVPIYVYEGAGHGFNCDRRKDFRADAAGIALDRTLALFDEHLR